MYMGQSKNLKHLSLAGVIIAFGIVFGDIGTSPLYTMNALLRNRIVDELLVIGGVSAIIWTLTIQTSFKYVFLTLNADNNGEGGIFSLYALIRRQKKWLVYFAILGGAMLMADSLITPPITVTSAIEGITENKNISIIAALIIISGIFFLQQFGTKSIGKLYGPLMIVWFMALFIFGFIHIKDDWRILNAFHPKYAIQFLIYYPNAFWLLSAIFLCTTGAEAMYSDLGHCGKKNIRLAWIFVKICLITNYMGQGAYVLNHFQGTMLPNDVKIFFYLFPDSMKMYAVILATLAAVIACQALISGAFSLVSEGIKLNLFPKLKINYPTEERGQLFIPAVNVGLWLGCCLVVLYFKEAKAMEGAYGLAISMTIMVTSILLISYMLKKRVHIVWVISVFVINISVELSFFIANLSKFQNGGYFTLIVGLLIYLVMFIWYKARKIKNRFVEFVPIQNYTQLLSEISEDKSIQKYATHLVYLTSADSKKEIEYNVIFSIAYNKPKRADVYWILHVDVLDVPYKREYELTEIVEDKICRIDFRLGFRENQRVHSMFKKVLEDIQQTKEIDVLSRYPSLHEQGLMGDFDIIVMEKFLSFDNKLSFFETLIMKGYFLINKFAISPEKAFGLNFHNVKVEKTPLVVNPAPDYRLHRKK